MIDQKFIFLILNCNKYRDKALKQKQTWLSNLPKEIVYYHVIGDPLLEEDFYFDDKEQILFIHVEDDYINLPKKMIRAFNAIQETFNFNYILKTDDDQNLNNINFIKTLCSILEKKEPKIHYGGQIVNVPIPYLSQYYKIHPELPKDLIIQSTNYSNGRFYFLSKESVQNLLNKQEQIEKEYLEDYAIGFYLSNQFKENKMNITSDKYFNDF
jgi:hypothetical protein